MPKFMLNNEIYDKCKKSGKFIFLEDIDIEKIKSTVNIAKGDLDAANSIKTNLKKQSNQWNSIYKLCYDALHELVEGFLRFDKIKVDNHQCLFAYLCKNHEELEFDWNFFEKFRTKRNGINYYGTPIDYNDFKEIEIQFNLYFNKLLKEIQNKL
jgi:hypothetical protein